MRKTRGIAERLEALVVLLFVLLPLPALAGDRILLLHSYHQGNAWADGVTDVVAETLKASGTDALLTVDYLDARREPQLFRRSSFSDLMRSRYRDGAIDLIIAGGDEALGFALRGRGDFFPDVPVVFCGVTHPRDVFHEAPPDLTGAVSDYDLEGTINLALDLHPDRHHIAAIGDLSDVGRRALNRLRDIESRFAWRADWVPLVGLSFDELHDAVMALPKTTILLYLSFSADGESRFYRPQDVAKEIGRWRPDLPLYAAWSFLVESGAAVGGRVILPAGEGRFAAETALKILRGEPVSSIPIRWSSPKVDLFHRDGLARFGLSQKDLPRGSLVVGDREPLYCRYPHVLPLLLVLLGGLSLLALHLLRRRRAEAAILDQRRFLERFIDLFPLPVFYRDEEKRYLYVNKAFADLMGRDKGTLIGKKPEELAPADMQEMIDRFGAREEEGENSGAESWTCEMACQDDLGRSRYALVVCRPHRDGEGRLRGIVSVVVDLSDHKEREETLLRQEERLLKALEGAAEGVWDWDVSADRLHCRLEGVTTAADEEGEMTLDDWRRRLHPQDIPAFDRALDEHLQGLSASFSCECRFRTDGGSVWILMRGKVLSRDERGRPLRLTGTLLDIGDKKEIEFRRQEAERELRRAVMTDRLTGALTRKYFEDLLSLQIRRSLGGGGPLSLILFDLDDFKAVNGRYGHLRGDAVLASVCDLVRLHVRAGDVLGRWGGKTFMLLTPDSIDGALQLSEKLRKLIEEEEFLSDRKITASFGVVVCRDGDSVESLAARADEALCRAKQSGKNIVHL